MDGAADAGPAGRRSGGNAALAAALLAAALLAATCAWGQGYRLQGNRVEVTADHLGGWSFPIGSVEVEGGRARPRLVREAANAVLDAHTFADKEGRPGGIRNVGSNLAGAAAIVDGDPTTWWEPNPADPVDTWWVEIDLGRLVWAERIVVRFADETEGDPFLQFKVLTSNGSEAFLQSKAFSYTVAGRSEGLNKTRRTFEFDLSTTIESDPDFSGDVIQYVQVSATASDRGRAELISEAQWSALPAAWRGDVVTFRRDGERLREVDRSEYDAIDDPEHRGPLAHYRRELPRLAEVEVWTEGDNVSLGTIKRGGRIQGYGNLGSEVNIVDGDYRSFWSAEVGFSVSGFGTDNPLNVQIQDPDRNLFLDLGSWYWLDRAFLVFDRQASGGAFPNYVITLSDGSRAPDGSLLFLPMASRGNGGYDPVNNRLFLQRNDFPLTPARYFRLNYHIVEQSLRTQISEIQLLGRGYLPQVSLTSGMIELGASPRILSAIHWDADVPPGTELRMRTRSGNELAREVHYFTNLGTEVTEAQYRKLLSFQRGDSTITVIPGTDWSGWSQFYAGSGAAITSPSPRRFAMVQATLVTADPDRAVGLRGLTIDLEDPLATQLLGEIGPHTVAATGRPDTLTVFLKPTIGSQSRGFDQVLVEAPPSAELALLDVTIGSESDLAAGGGTVYGKAQLGQSPTASDSLWVRLPETVRSNRVVAVRFASTLYLASNPFAVQVGLGDGESRVWQRADGDDAVDLVEGRGLTVFTPLTAGLLGRVEVGPNPFTPNGDGVNDAVVFDFPVFRVQGGKDIVLEVFGLDGRRVLERSQPVAFAAGLHRVEWDGRDGDGVLVAPGLYLCRIGLEVDTEQGRGARVARSVAVIY